MHRDQTESDSPCRVGKSVAVDAYGRNVWPILHQSLRQMKWDQHRRMGYRRLVFGSAKRAALFTIVLVAAILPMMLWLYWQTLQLSVAGPRSGASLLSLSIQWLALTAASLGLTLAVKRLYLRRAAQRHIIPSLLCDRQCGACMYPLGDAPAGADGCTICPECGSAWRLASD